jgi:hypothetical protein
MLRYPTVPSIRHGSWWFGRLPDQLRHNMHTWQCIFKLNLDNQPPNDAFVWPGIWASLSSTPGNNFRRLYYHGLRHSFVPTSKGQRSIRQRRLGMRNQHNFRSRLLHRCRRASLSGSRVHTAHSLTNRSEHHGDPRLGEHLLSYLRQLLWQDVSLFHARSNHEDKRASRRRVRTNGRHDNVDAAGPDLRHRPMQISTPVGYFAQEYLLRPSELQLRFRTCTEYILTSTVGP